MPRCNGVDRGDASPRKRADFPRVINHEKLCKTIEWGNRKRAKGDLRVHLRIRTIRLGIKSLGANAPAG